MALTKTSIIKTRSQSRTGTTARTGTNDDTIAPAPVAVTTGRTTGTTNDPVVPTTVPVDLFAGRPKTGALKDPPPCSYWIEACSSRSRLGLQFGREEACCEAQGSS